MNNNFEVLAYIGPDAMLPMTSIIATVVGMTLMFGRYAFQVLTRLCQIIVPRPVHRALKNHQQSRRRNAVSRRVRGGARRDGA
jgi:hypothetical protein